MGLGFKGTKRRWSFLSLSSFLSLLVNPSSQWWLYSQLEVLCVVILALFVVEFISSSFKLFFVLAFQTTSFLLHFEFGVLLLLHELQIVVQAPSFDIYCHNSIFKLCCCIWALMNDVFWQWLHITFTIISFPFFSFQCCFCFHVINCLWALLFYLVCNNSKFCKIQAIGFSFAFLSFSSFISFLEWFMNIMCFFSFAWQILWILQKL
jgi:hypothetical protein